MKEKLWEVLWDALACNCFWLARKEDRDGERILGKIAPWKWYRIDVVRMRKESWKRIVFILPNQFLGQNLKCSSSIEEMHHSILELQWKSIPASFACLNGSILMFLLLSKPCPYVMPAISSHFTHYWPNWTVLYPKRQKYDCKVFCPPVDDIGEL